MLLKNRDKIEEVSRARYLMRQVGISYHRGMIKDWSNKGAKFNML